MGPGPAGPPPSWAQVHLTWLQHLVMICLGLPLVGGLVHTLVVELPLLRTAKGWKELVRSRVFQAGVKFWLAISTVLVLILGIAGRGDQAGYDVRTYRPIFGYIATCLAMSERVEATMSKVVLWVIGTVVGGTLGYVAMISSDLATNPYALMAIICTFTFMVGLLSGHHFRVGIVLTLMTFNALILCQYKGCCDATGSAKVYGARVLAVIFGSCIPVLISNLILPWFTSDWALETMGGTFKESIGLVRGFYSKFYHDGCKVYASVAGEEALQQLQAKYGPPPPAPAGPPPPPAAGTQGVPAAAGPPLPPLQAKIAVPLAGVQVSLIKDAAIWQRGMLSTPKIVQRVLHAHLVLLDRLAAMALVVNSPAGVDGTFSGWGFEHIVMPLNQEIQAILGALDDMAGASAALLCSKADEEAAAARDAIAAAIATLDKRRLEIRRHVQSMRAAFHHGVRASADDELPYLTHPDDAVRVFSFIYAWIKVVDKSTALARTALSHKDRAAHTADSIMAWIK